MQIKCIIFIFILTLLLTGCTFEGENLNKKIEPNQKSLEKDPIDMSLEEVEQELEEIENLEADEGLEEIDEEF